MNSLALAKVSSDPPKFPELSHLHMSARDLPDHLHAGSGSITLKDGAAATFCAIRGGVVSASADSLLFVHMQDASGGARPVCIRESTIFPMNLSFDLERLGCASPNFLDPNLLRISGPAFLAAGGGANAVYHWLHDYLPRLVAIERTGMTKCPIIVPAAIEDPRNSFIWESLEMIGVPRERLVFAGYRPICADEIWIPDNVCSDNSVHLQLLSEIRMRLLAGAEVETEARPERRIFIWRTGNRRGLSNPDEVESVLTESGVEKISFETLRLRDQIRLAHSASLIAGPHGAGLYHSLFMREGRVVELFPVDPTGRERNAPCWSTILGVHAREGRDVHWTALNSNIVPLSAEQFDLFQITADCAALRKAII